MAKYNRFDSRNKKTDRHKKLDQVKIPKMRDVKKDEPQPYRIKYFSSKQT